MVPVCSVKILQYKDQLIRFVLNLNVELERK